MRVHRTMDLAYTCVKKHQLRLYVCHQMRCRIRDFAFLCSLEVPWLATRGYQRSQHFLPVRSHVAPRLLTHALMLTCSECSFCVACGSEAYLSVVAVFSTSLATTCSVRHSGSVGSERLRVGICSRPGVSVLVRDLDISAPDAADERRLEVIADGLPLFHGAQLAIDTTMSPLGRDGAPHLQCANVDGAAMLAARRRKQRRHPELAGEDGRARLVVLACEVGGRWSPVVQSEGPP